MSEKITVRADRKYKMDKDEVQMLLHLRRKGSYLGKDKTKFSRKQKHSKNFF